MFPSASLRFLALGLILAAPVALAQSQPSAAASLAPASAEKPANAENAGAPTSGDFLSGRFASLSGDHAKAIRYLEQALAADPNNATLSGQLLVLYLWQGDMDKAVERAKSLQNDAQREHIVDLVLAVYEAHQGRFAEAEKDLKSAFADAKGVIWLPLMDAWMRAGQGLINKPVQPADILPDAKTKAPPFLSYHLALLNDFAGFPEMAEKQYDLAVADRDRAPFRAIEAAADFYRRHHKTAKLHKLAQDYISAHPQMSTLIDSDDSVHMAMLAAQGAPENQQSLPPLISTPQQGMAEVLFTMGSVLYSMDATQDTVLYLRMALYLRPDFALADLLLGNVLEGDGNFAEAAQAYNAVSPQSPLFARALLRRAYMLEEEGKTDEALKMLDARAASHPQESDALVVKGDLLRSQGRYADAAIAYTQALARIPKPGEQAWSIFFARGTCYEREGKWPKAEADLRMALSLSADEPEALNYLGYSLLVRNEDVEGAKKMIQQAYSLQPDSPQIVDSLGWADYKTGDIEDAVRYLEQAVDMLPSDPTVNDHLGDAYWQAGRKTEARYQWQQALAFKPDPFEEAAIRRKLRDGLPPIPILKEPTQAQPTGAPSDSDAGAGED